MSRGCTSFLVTVIEVPTATPGLKDIPIVREFLGMIPPELMMIPPGNVIEFVIGVVTGTTPNHEGTLQDGASRAERAEGEVAEFDG